MIRWRFLLTRVLLVVAVLALLRWSLGPLVQFASVQTLQRSVGARVDIAQTRVGLFPPRIQYVDFEVGDPREEKAMANAFSARTVDLTLDGNALMHRRWVVREGRISGIQVGGQRATSGHLDVAPPESPSDQPSMLTKLVGGLSSAALDKLESAANDLETVRRSQQIRDRWKTDYQELARRAKALEDEIREIREQARGIDNPLRDLPRLQATLERAKAMRQEMVSLRARMDQLPTQVRTDWIAMEEAKQIDLERINDSLPAPVDSPHDLGPELLRDVVQTQVNLVQQYLNSARQIADWTVRKPETTERQRGDDIRLVKAPLPPRTLVRKCQVDGIMSIDRDAYTLTGVLENLTSETERLTEPLRARLRLEGPRVVRIDYQRHYPHDGELMPRDVLVVHWPKLDLPSQQLGNADDVQLAIAGGPLDLYVQVEAVGDRLRGQLVSRQPGAQLDLKAAPKYEKLAAVKSLKQTLGDVDAIEVQANFTGSWRQMDLDLNTNLSGAFRRGLQDAAREQVLASRELLRQRIEREHRQQMAKLQEWLGEQQTMTRDLLAKADNEIDELKEKLTRELPEASIYVGKLKQGLRTLK